MEQFTRKLKIREIFWNKENVDDSLRRKKSTKPINNQNDELNNLVRNIELLEPDNIALQDNLSKDERVALVELINNKDIIITPADKGSSIVIMNTDYYRDKLVMSDHLNSNAYEKVEINSDTEIISKLKELVDKHSCLTVNEKNYLKDYEWESSELYVVPKIQKM